jgi:chemotaxis response regulator CheB
MAEFPIVGIGSSAGGLEALQKLFGAMPPDSGLAFIVATHLDPTQVSHLTELLSRCTKMPVVQIERSIRVGRGSGAAVLEAMLLAGSSGPCSSGRDARWQTGEGHGTDN